MKKMKKEDCKSCGSKDSVFWNPYNKVTQCHACGTIKEKK